MIQLIATGFCFIAFVFWLNAWLKSDGWVEQLFNLWFAIVFGGMFFWGMVSLVTS